MSWIHGVRKSLRLLDEAGNSWIYSVIKDANEKSRLILISISVR